MRMKLKQKKRFEPFQMFVDIVIFLFALIILYPIVYVVSCSLSDSSAVSSGQVVLFPVQFTLSGYAQIFKYSDIWTGYANTIFYAVVGTSLSLAVTLPCAYALSRRGLKFKGFWMVFFMITMYISGGLIPQYLNIKGLGLYNSRFSIVILGALSVYNMIVAKAFFENSIPYELTEAAKIDGCNEFGVFFRIVMPLSKAITTVLMLYYGIDRWNAYFDAMIYLDDRSKYPLQLFLREILLQSKITEELIQQGGLDMETMQYYMELAKSAELIKYCVIIVATLPMMIIFPYIQKYFEKGVMIGSVKG